MLRESDPDGPGVARSGHAPARARPRKRRDGEQFDWLIEYTSDVIAVLEPDWRIRSITDSVEQVLGYRADDLHRALLTTLAHPEDLLQVAEYLALVPGTEGRGVPFECRLRHRNGTWRFVELIGNNPPDRSALQGIVCTIRDITEHELAREQQAGLLLKATIEAQEEERERICLDIHDGICQMLSAAFQYLEAAGSQPDLPEIVHSRISTAGGLVRDALREAREVLATLRPAALDSLGLVATLRHQLADLGGRAGLVVEFSHDITRPSRAVETVLYRVILEAVHNVIKHAHATVLEVQLRQVRGHIVASVRDDGVGFDATALSGKMHGSGVGLLSMRKRTELANGRFDLLSRIGGGTLVRVQLPLDREVPIYPEGMDVTNGAAAPEWRKQ